MAVVVGQDQSICELHTCKKCGAINKVFPNEIRNLYTGKDYSGGSDGRDGFNCAGCGSEVVTYAW